MSAFSVQTAQPFGNFAALPIYEIFAGPTDWANITEITYVNQSSNGSPSGIGLVRASAQGVGGVQGLEKANLYRPAVGSQPLLAVSQDPNLPPANLKFFNAWRTAPTFSGALLRRHMGIGAPGGSFGRSIWKFPRGLQMLPNTSLVIIGLNQTGNNGILSMDLDV